VKEVRRQEFFHYQTVPQYYWQGVGVDAWQVGRSYLVGDGFNPYFDFYNQYWGAIPWADEGRKTVVLLRNALSNADDGSIARAVNHLGACGDQLGKECALVQELVFEEVRRQHFPTYPSRQRCMWVVSSEAGVRYWQQRVDIEKRWFRVRLTGKLHTASEVFLAPDTVSLHQLRKLAWQYWSGFRGGGEEQDEILFEGVIEVVEELDFAAITGCA